MNTRPAFYTKRCCGRGRPRSRLVYFPFHPEPRTFANPGHQPITRAAHAIAQSAVSSNHIEGVEIDHSRISTVIFGYPARNDRDEEEVAGYRDALNLIHTRGAKFPVSGENILTLHKLSLGELLEAYSVLRLRIPAARVGQAFLPAAQPETALPLRLIPIADRHVCATRHR